jgi:hypothetical protein
VVGVGLVGVALSVADGGEILLALADAAAELKPSAEPGDLRCVRSLERDQQRVAQRVTVEARACAEPALPAIARHQGARRVPELLELLRRRASRSSTVRRWCERVAMFVLLLSGLRDAAAKPGGRGAQRRGSPWIPTPPKGGRANGAGIEGCGLRGEKAGHNRGGHAGRKEERVARLVGRERDAS